MGTSVSTNDPGKVAWGELELDRRDAALFDMDALRAHYIVRDAMDHGWHLEEGNMLCPPRSFLCRGWAAQWRPLAYQGGALSVPHWICDQSVRRTGAWVQERK